jgi:hypothetical protein
MGQAVWLYLWCLRHQTRRNGLVLGGTPITYNYINQRLGQPERTVKRWLSVLRKYGYIEVTYLAYKKLRIMVLKSKKFNFKQLPLPIGASAKSGLYEQELSAKSGLYMGPKMAYSDTKNGLFKQSGSMRSNETPEIETLTTAQAPLIPIALWLSFVQMRQKLRKPLTDHGGELIRRKVQTLVDHGEDAVEVVEQSIRNGWQDVFPIRKENGNGRESFQERTQRKSQEEIADMRRNLDPVVHEVERGLPKPSSK